MNLVVEIKSLQRKDMKQDPRLTWECTLPKPVDSDPDNGTHGNSWCLCDATASGSLQVEVRVCGLIPGRVLLDELN